MEISAHVSSLPDKPRTGCWGQQYSHALGRPILHRRLILSQTSAGKSSLVTHRQSLLGCFVLFLCSRLAPVPSSRPAGAEARRAQGPSRLAVAITLRLAPVFAGHALTGPSTARGSSSSGRIGFDALEDASLVEYRPGDPGELVGEGDRQQVAVQALLRRFDPRLEPIALPSLWLDLDQHDPGGLNEQRAQIAIAAC